MFKKSALALMTGAGLFATAGVAHAAANQTGWALSLLGQYTIADDDTDRPTDDGMGVRFGVSKAIGSWLVLEGLVGYQEFDAATAGGLQQDEYTLGVDYQFHLPPSLGAVHPYLIAGFGGVRTSDLTAPNRTTTDFGAAAGLGIDIGLSERWDLTADLKHRWVFWDETRRNNADPKEIQFGIGVSYDLTGPQVVVAAPVDGDADGDGVPNSLDRCPNTRPGAVVDAYGCEVTAVGDADGDGVPDNMDKCPNTPAGTRVDGEGCPAPETIVIYFAFDSSELNGPARNALDIVAANLKERSYVVAIANGHADRTGTEEYNQALSQRRAQAVADYLTSKGVPAGQLRTRAFGETRPVNEGRTPEERARNRRVEINLIEE
ncbi:MAG: OmpA family protein [Oceanococcaceae bacterium]